MATTSLLPFGALLKRYRRAAGLSQEALAERAGLSTRGVQDLERGIHGPRGETVRLLVAALGLDAAASGALMGAAYPDVSDSTAPSAGRPALAKPPIPATSLVGREREVAAVCSLLRQAGGALGSRLLTLTGPGGVGKTRLALAIASEVAAGFSDGVAWVELAPLRDPTLVTSTVAGALGVRESGDEPLVDTVAGAIAHRRLLLVMDNCEHLLPVVPLLATLLAAGPGLVVLATSRARLRLRGERDFPVSPLTLPSVIGTTQPLLEGLADVAAVRLFLERAAEVRPGFVLTQENAPAVVEICRRLDGLPLALELAAARLRVLPPSALLARLERRLPLLTGGPRDAPARQRTMRDAIAWSYDLLHEAEQRLFQCVSVFNGGFSLEAAQAVAGVGGATAEESVLDVLISLDEQSLARAIDRPHGEPRFTVLETVREFAQDQLATSGATAVVERAHAAYYLALAERAEPELTGPAQAEWLDQLDEEHANIRAALDWSLRYQETDTSLRFVAALWHFWQVRGHVAEGRAWAEAALAQSDWKPTVARAKALRAAGSLAEYHGDYDEAVRRHEAAATVWRDLGDERNLARTLDHLGNCAHDRGDFARGAALHEQALVLARKVGDTRGIASALGNLGIMAIHTGQLASARQRLEEALTLMRELNHAHGVALALSQLGIVALREGQVERAVALNTEALESWRVLGDQDEAATTLIHLGVAMRLAGDLTGARAQIEEARRSLAHLGNRRATAVALEALAALAHQQGDGPHAAELFGDALALAQEVDDKVTIAACLEGVAALAAAQGYARSAARLLGATAALREAIGAPIVAHQRAEYDRIVAATRAALDTEAFDLAWAAGRALPHMEAIGAAQTIVSTDLRAPP